jgi:hypothetical protein
MVNKIRLLWGNEENKSEVSASLAVAALPATQHQTLHYNILLRGYGCVNGNEVVRGGT